MRMVGTVSRGIRCPVIKQGDDLRLIVAESVLAAAENDGFSLRDKDVVGVTESVVARSQGNYATIDDIAEDIQNKFGGDTLGVIFPILSRNRFSVCLKGIAKGMKKLFLMLGYPSDEVGNHLFPADMLEEKNVNPWAHALTEAEYREKFGYELHPFTGMDYVAYYKSIIEETGCKAEILFSNNAKDILKHTKNVLACDIHTRKKTVRALKAAGAETALSLSDILTAPVNGCGYNEQYGLLGSNKATEESVKLFPRDCQGFVEGLQGLLKEKTGKHIEVLIYGDGAFKDPQGQIWELADPVVSPGYTDGLKGTPNEIKLKYIADNQLKGLSGKELDDAMKAYITQKDDSLVGAMEAQGTTPRQLTDLIGSLCDLTSGSGDKGTPVILIQGYFDNYTTENV